MDKIYIYEIFLEGSVVVNSGDNKFPTEKDAREDANNFISNLLKDDSEFKNNIVEDFDISVYAVTEDDLARGW